MAGEMHDVLVVIVAYNSSHVLDGLLDSIPPALGPLTAEVVVVDNGSTDDTVARLENRTDLRLVRSTNLGYAGGINLGVEQGGPSRAILILNPDLRMSPGCVPALMKSLFEQPDTGVVAPLVREPDGRIALSLRREPTLLRAAGLDGTGLPVFGEYVRDPAAYRTAGTVDWALGAALIISRDCFQAIGGWDASFFLYSEETDFCLRARDHGYLTRFDPTAEVTHIGGQSGQNNQTHAMQIINRVRLYRRRHGAPASFGYYLLTIASEITWAVRPGRTNSRFAVAALLRPSLRPAQLGLSGRLIPR
jgi:N-acetylglucosaminyl-diphospho-decaprenol L-rhamnosyltransferase